jgi:hypothetical protein
LPFCQRAVGPARRPASFLSNSFVEKIVDFFRESGEEIQNSPLAKGHSFLVDKANPYLSITLEMAIFSVCRGPRTLPTAGLSMGYPQNEVKIL